ncbi:MAG: hypothetical protein FWH04_00580 [Oscillospiraceae bacterium]|nr:hypothetical protein [Oscillospiraceae bacterium]
MKKYEMGFKYGFIDKTGKEDIFVHDGGADIIVLREIEEFKKFKKIFLKPLKYSPLIYDNSYRARKLPK